MKLYYEMRVWEIKGRIFISTIGIYFRKFGSLFSVFIILGEDKVRK